MRKRKNIILNLQEHGFRMLKSIGLSVIASVAFYLLKAPVLFLLFSLITAILSITLLLLVLRENRQGNGAKTKKTKKQG